MVLAVGQLVSVLITPLSSPLLVVGNTIIDLTPPAVREAIISNFGSNDKLILFSSIGVGIFIFGLLAGRLEGRRPIGTTLFALLGLGVAAAALVRPGAGIGYVVPTVAGVVAGIATLRLLTRYSRSQPSTSPTLGESRRDFVKFFAIATAAAAAAFAAGKIITDKILSVAADRARFLVPTPLRPAKPVVPAVTLDVPGITPFVTANRDFYRVDTALTIPAVAEADWELRIHGMVDRQLVLNFADLRRREAVERIITLTCVSNPIGGNLLGTARWTGYLIRDLLAEAGVQKSADMVLSSSSDGFSAGTPVEVLTDDRDALLAVAMNGEPLPIEHGYPARLIVPGLYGYVSATKWVIDLEVTRFDRANGYWTTRGWSAKAPIKTAARVDVPASFATVDSGAVVIAGLAWAQTRGITKVEVQVDGSDWRVAELAGSYSNDTWRQWRITWDLGPGNHTVRARATDSTGATQTEQRAEPMPDGATGWPSRVFTAR
ncbi:molybdopterin-dependent oxidoreductase [Smaragdicoccus niigatensis]|uniref:molybdopterin-dependent oxidoreductase n=1 Tax=Smaragdicoccus niigatensis TaxID=359359 RepID=UPI000767C7A0|nr:molybdopterin-dependent oxidoreductase [Smaragdicoccus niigatensis]